MRKPRRTEIPAGPFARALLAWYARERRDLPWRATKDPYRIWVSEIMLQQTQVATVIPYYARFLKRFPTLKTLALADREAVLKAWEGLGYYRRAAHLHEGARAVLARHAGRFPSDPEAVRALPGIGDYTAGAIRSIALGQDAALVDGNVARVLTRLAAIRQPPLESGTKKTLWALAVSLLPPGRAGDFNQALMELGALVCTPRAPACPSCPVAGFCRARREGLTDRIPARPARKALPRRRETIAVISRDERLYLHRRPEGGLLGGLWEFPAVPDPGEAASQKLLAALFRRSGVRARPCGSLGRFRHTFTHFKLEVGVGVYEAAGKGREANARRWVDAATLDELPVTRLTRRIHEAWLKRQEAPLPLFEGTAAGI